MLRLGICIFVEHNIRYQPCKFEFSRISGSNFTEGGGKNPCAAPGEKSPVLLGLRYLVHNMSLGFPSNMLSVVDSLIILNENICYDNSVSI